MARHSRRCSLKNIIRNIPKKKDCQLWFFASEEKRKKANEKREDKNYLVWSLRGSKLRLPRISIVRSVTIERCDCGNFFWHAYDNFSSPHHHLIQIKNSFILRMLPCCLFVYSLPPAIILPALYRCCTWKQRVGTRDRQIFD